MKTSFLFAFYILSLALALPDTLDAQALRSELYNSGCGMEFWGAFPLNDFNDQPLYERQIEIISVRNGEVTYETTADGKPVLQKYQLQAGVPLVLSHPDTPMPEVQIDSTRPQFAYHITSTVPVWVTALNSKSLTGDACQLIPAHLLGKEYVHCSYYDFNEFRGWAGGFCVVATENATTITLYVKSSSNGRTSDGRSRSVGSIDTQVVKLDRGYVYSLQGDGTTRGTFDISGTRIVSDKPVAVISYHNRTSIPALNMAISSSDYLMEMLPPTSTWGKQYITREFTPRKGNGDFYRVVSLEPNTTVRCAWYNASRKLVGEKTFNLNNACDFAEYNNQTVTGPLQAGSISGSAVWTSTKPFYLAHYSYTGGWDNTSAFDPFMIAVPPVEQYLPTSIVNVPAGPEILPPNQYITVYAVGDTADSKQTLLSSIMLDNEQLTKRVPTLTNNYIPGTNLLSVTLPIIGGGHLLTSSTRVSAELYATATDEVWGLTGARSFNILRTSDTLAPTMTYSKEEEYVKEVEYAENRSYGTQSDLGISSFVLVDSANIGIDYLTTVATPSVIAKGDWKLLRVRCTMINHTRDAWAVFGICDRAGNVRTDTVWFRAGIPTVPVLRTPPHDTTMGTQQIQFTWEGTPNTARYHLYVLNTTTNQVVINDSLISTTSLTRQLALASSYRWKVRAINANGSSIYSPGWQFSINKTLGIVELTSPADASHLPSGNITAVWKAVVGADSYNILVSKSGTEIVNANVSATTTNVNLTSIGNYEWKVRALQNSGTTGDWSAPWIFIVDAVNPVDETECTQNTLYVYPQPAYSLVELHGECTENILHVEIIGANGKQYFSGGKTLNAQRIIFNIDELSTGAYFMRICIADGSVQDIPFVVVH